jgi:hypothetical protein
MRLKAVWYKGSRRSADGRVAYFVDARNVYFTYLPTKGRRHVRSTINAAEDIVLAITAAEWLRWQKHTFHDIQTWHGYPWYPRGWYVVDRLILRDLNGEPHVEDWTPIARSPLLDDDEKPSNGGRHATSDERQRGVFVRLPGLPLHIHELFRPYLDPAASPTL